MSDLVLTARFDRVDRHQSGRLRVLDYKTGDAGKTPEQVHRVRRRGEVRWQNLQLPLYRLMAQAQFQQTVDVGFFNLPRRLGDVGVHQAEWSDGDLRHALETAREVVTAIREGRFWPPSPPAEHPAYEAEYAGVCLDRCVRRFLPEEDAATVAHPLLADFPKGGER